MNDKNNVTKTFGFKIFVIFVIGLFFLIPMAFIEETISDRKYYQKEAVKSIIEPIGGELYLDGAFIVIPYTYTYQTKTNEELKTIRKQDYRVIVASDLNVQANATMSTLERGIFKAPMFNVDIKMNGKFDRMSDGYLAMDAKEAMILIPAKNKQNFKSLPVVEVNGKPLKLIESPNLPTSRNDVLSQGFAYKIHSNSDTAYDMIHKGFDFSVRINAQGGNAIHIMPNVGDTKISLSSNWSDPSFQGKWLPSSRQVNESGFSAVWEVPSFSSPFSVREFKNSNHNERAQYISTQFLLLNDNYTQTIKSIKYSILFIFVPFFALLLCELLAKKSIHVIQYVLIGLANAVFYMLLLSISEHLSFNISYLISACMVIILTGLYVYAFAKAGKIGAIFAGVELIAYGFLFSLLQLTDYALLVGTIGIFVAIATAMYFTRNINTQLQKENI